MVNEGAVYKNIAAHVRSSTSLIKFTMFNLRKEFGFDTTMELMAHLRRRPIIAKQTATASEAMPAIMVFGLPQKLSRVAQLIMEGKPNNLIADEISKSASTVARRIAKANRLTGTSRRVELGMWYRQYLDYREALQGARTGQMLQTPPLSNIAANASNELSQ